VTDKPDKPKPLFVPDPVAALNKRIQRANRKGLVDLAIEEQLAKPASLGELKTLAFSEDTIRLIEQLTEAEETGLEIDLSDSGDQDGET
jgi:hypothetical protein